MGYGLQPAPILLFARRMKPSRALPGKACHVLMTGQSVGLQGRLSAEVSGH